MNLVELEETSDVCSQNILKNEICINERYVWLSTLQDTLQSSLAQICITHNKHVLGKYIILSLSNQIFPYSDVKLSPKEQNYNSSELVGETDGYWKVKVAG